jgi:putative acetyltransferase
VPPIVARIRPLQPDDAQGIEKVHKAAIRAFGSQAYDDVQVSAWAATGSDETGWGIGDLTALDDDDRHAVVAEVDGDVAGFGRIRLGVIPDAPPDRLLALVDQPVAEVTAVYVHPQYARKGHGSKILAALETSAPDTEATVIGLLAARNAVAFYESNGYETVACRPHVPAEGVKMKTVWMEKVCSGP